MKVLTWFARASKRLSDGSDGPTPSEEIPRLESWEAVNGKRLRLTYLLCRGSLPDDPTIENTYRETHL